MDMQKKTKWRLLHNYKSHNHRGIIKVEIIRSLRYRSYTSPSRLALAPWSHPRTWHDYAYIRQPITGVMRVNTTHAWSAQNCTKHSTLEAPDTDAEWSTAADFGLFQHTESWSVTSVPTFLTKKRHGCVPDPNLSTSPTDTHSCMFF
jgi:hypothetical protein